MKSNCSLSITRPMCGDGREVICIEIRDEASRIKTVVAEVGMEEFTKAVTGLSEQKCTTELKSPELFGLAKETVPLSAEMPKDYSCDKRDEIAYDVCCKVCPEGWEVDPYFRSQSSFTRKDGLEYANTRAFRYVNGVKNEHQTDKQTESYASTIKSAC